MKNPDLQTNQRANYVKLIVYEQTKLIKEVGGIEERE